MKIRLLVAAFFVFNVAVSAKSYRDFFKATSDSNYIESYYNDLIVRIYSGEKAHSLDLFDLDNPYQISYLPNGYYNLGIGANFHSFGLSLATKIPFLQNNEYKNGETRRFGIQSYLYTSKFSIDLLTSFSKGYYLNNSFEHLKSYSKEREYLRPDIKSASIGLSINYIFNNSRFSYKAAFSDTEKQIKSAGSFIAGGSILSYHNKADSAFIPNGINKTNFLKSRDIKESGILAFNANAGYAYSLVFLHDGIISLSFTFGAGIQDNRYNSVSLPEVNNWRPSFNQTGRFGIGYRIMNYFFQIGIIRSTQYTSLKLSDLRIANGTDFMQFSIGKRIAIN